ncbi:hypothetical protein Bbelb_361490 [Branchiostoma belcheri]|nr:hypothetical protein Bbelb_361490 [Branchiostoma belcheri]
MKFQPAARENVVLSNGVAMDGGVIRSAKKTRSKSVRFTMRVTQMFGKVTGLTQNVTKFIRSPVGPNVENAPPSSEPYTRTRQHMGMIPQCAGYEIDLTIGDVQEDHWPNATDGHR